MSLPENWTFTKLGKVCDKPQYGWTSKAAQNGRIKYLRTTDLSSGKVDWDSVPFCLDEPNDVEKYQVRNNDIVISRAGSVGLSYRIENPPPNSVFASYLIRMRALSVEHKYLGYFLKSSEYWQQISDVAAGIAVQNINATKLSELDIPLAPLPEQKRIVAKLDTLFAHLDQLKARLEKIPTLLKQFRQAVLTQAVMGKLTEEWREGRNLREVEITKIRKEGKVLLTDRTNEYDLVELPNKWNWKIISEVVDVKGGKRLPKGEQLVSYNTGFPYIKAGDLKNGTVQVGKLEYLLPKTQQKIKRYNVSKGDVYITNVGACIGDAGIIPENLDGANLTENALKLCNHEGVFNYYLSFWLRSPVAQAFIKRTILSGAQGKLALGRVESFPIPLCPFEEQKEIVRRVESLFALADGIEASYQTLKEKIDQLPQAILSKAFRGELVGQNVSEKMAEYKQELDKLSLAAEP